MTNQTAPRPARPKTFCPRCKQRGVVTVKLPSGATMCFRCIRDKQPAVYQNLVDWVKDHPPIEQG